VRRFVAVGSIIFGLIFAVHMLRVYYEGADVWREPIFIITSIASLVLAIWSAVLLQRSKSQKD
jgi:heme/copper-type cytochrome/quinol oxidase subunit 1